MEHQKPVQLYRYNVHDLDVIKSDEEQIVTLFHPEKDPDYQHWLNYHSMKDRTAIERLCTYLGVDKLIQEDLFKGTKRPRLEEYDGYVFFTIISALPTDKSNTDLKKERISFILGANYLVSFQEKVSDHFPIVRDRLKNRQGKIREKGPDFLLFRMLGAIVENYTEVLDEIAETIERLEAMVVRYPKSEVLRRIEWQKRKLLDLRKTVLPMRELVSQLERVESPVFDDVNAQYFLELKDSCIAVIDEIDSQKLILDGVSNLYYAVQGQKMNEIMKVLTVISAIFIPLTFIVGVYGMNFENMPELHWKYGYFLTIGLMALIALVLVFIFWKRGWLKRNE